LTFFNDDDDDAAADGDFVDFGDVDGNDDDDAFGRGAWDALSWATVGVTSRFG
jgi:hypothetical protein